MLSANFIIPLNYILWVKFTLITLNYFEAKPEGLI